MSSVRSERILVAYASRHGATAGIADRLAVRLDEHGFGATSSDVGEVSDIDSYDAFVIGSAAYMYHWLKDANRFVKKHKKTLAQKPVWLFSSGPLGTDLVDEDGNDVLETSRPKEFDELASTLHPRGERVFFGAWDPDLPPVGMAEKMLKKMPIPNDALPVGDFRDWEAIDAWADEIAAEFAKLC